MDYPSEKADSLELFVRKKSVLSRTAHHVYVAIRWLEIDKGVGLCGKVFAGYREIVFWAKISDDSVKKALLEIQMAGLAFIRIGDSNKAKKQATEIQRKTLDEIKAQSRQEDSDASRLAEALIKRSFRFGDKEITQCWSVGKTGRVISSKGSSKLSIQQVNADDRWNGLKAGLAEGLTLVHADIKQAEPSIIKCLLNISLEHDLYRKYMDATGCCRDEAKEKINMLAYCKDSMACFKHWSESAQAALGDYVHKLAEYKKKLFAEFRKSRSVRTLAGRLIESERGRRLHAGIAMNWRVQGTVADIINPACLRLLELTTVIIPVHDAIYAVLPNDQVPLVKAAIIEKARTIGLIIKVETQVDKAALAVHKTTTGKTIENPVNLSTKPPLITT